MKNKHWLLIFVLCVQACGKEEKHVEYHSNEKLALEGQLLNGKKVGEWIEYDSLGNKLNLMKYKDDTLMYRELYIKGKLLASEEMRGDTKNGKTIAYYENGNIESKTIYNEGKQVDEQLTYFPDGTLKSKYIRKESGDIVEFYQYYSNRQLFVYAKDLQNGEFNIYDSLGNRTYDLLYENAELVDTLKVY